MRLRQVLTAVVVSGSLVFWAGGGWAQEAVPPSTPAEDVELTPEQLAELAARPAVNLPRLTYSQVEGGFQIVVSGIPLKEVSDYVFNGQIISAEMKSFMEQGIVEVVEKDDDSNPGFTLTVKIEPSSLPEGSEFGLNLSNGLKMSSPIKFSTQEKLSWSNRIRVRGTVYKNCWWGWCNVAPYEKVTIYKLQPVTKTVTTVTTRPDGSYSYDITDGYCDDVAACTRDCGTDGWTWKRNDLWTTCMPDINDQVINLHIK